MEKLSLEMLTSEEVLQRSQMKKITGGYGGGSDCSHNVCTSLPCCSPRDECKQGKCSLR